MERKPELKLGLSMQEMVDPSTFYAVFMPVEWYTFLAQRVGLKGIEFFPTRVSHYQAKNGLISPLVKDNILSAHQSFRGERNLTDVFKNKTWRKRAIATTAFLALPHKDSSMETLQRLQKWVGRDIPIVAYPESGPGPAVLYTEQDFSQRLASLKNRIFQPSAQHLKKWDISRPETIQDFLEQGGWAGLCLDLFHIRERNKELNTPNWRDYLPALLPFTKEIHVSAGRIDSPQDEIDTMNELVDIYTGAAKSDLAKMLEFIGLSGWQGVVVSEMPAFAVRSVAGVKAPILAPRDLITAHRKIAETIRGLLQT